MILKRLAAMIKKEFWLLSRSKVSTLGILLGPMIIILLVGLLFSNAGGVQPTAGVVNEGFTDAQAYVDSLSESFRIVEYDDEDVCRVAVRSGTIATCVVFSPGEPPAARILVDPSDINSVYSVLGRVSGTLDEQSSQVRESLTERVLETLQTTTLTLAEEEVALRATNDLIERQRASAGSVYQSGRGASIDVEIVSSQELDDAVSDSLEQRDAYRSLASQVLSDYRSFVNRQSTEDNPLQSQLDDIEALEEQLDDADSLDDAQDVFEDLIDMVANLDSQIENNQEQVSAITDQSAEIADNLADAQDNLESSIAEVAALQLYLAGLDIGAQDISSPIDTQVEPVIADEDSLGFLLPYFVALLLMFTAVLLASSLIVRERESAAYFRNFITPTPEWMFVLATFASSVIVLLVQLLLVLLVVWPLFGFSLLSRPFVSVTLLFVVASFFTLLGMLIGYVFRSREAALLGAMGVAASFMLFSGFVFPLDGVSDVVRSIIEFNPFVLSAEMFKAASILNLPFSDLLPYLLALALYCLMLYALIMIVQRLARVHAFERAGTSEKVGVFLDQDEVPEHRQLVLAGKKVRSKKTLVSALKSMSDVDYERYASHNSNVIADWIRDTYKDEKLAAQLQNKSRQGAIRVLQGKR